MWIIVTIESYLDNALLQIFMMEIQKRKIFIFQGYFSFWTFRHNTYGWIGIESYMYYQIMNVKSNKLTFFNNVEKHIDTSYKSQWLAVSYKKLNESQSNILIQEYNLDLQRKVCSARKQRANSIAIELRSSLRRVRVVQRGLVRKGEQRHLPALAGCVRSMLFRRYCCTLNYWIATM